MTRYETGIYALGRLSELWRKRTKGGHPKNYLSLGGPFGGMEHPYFSLN